jgi:hypothetical protein
MKSHWQNYKKLELIAEATPVPQTNHSPLVAQLAKLWNSNTNRSIEKLSPQQHLQHLERSLKLECPDSDGAKDSTVWQTLWTCLTQPILEWNLSNASEPEVRRIADQNGHAWWYVYDPITGQKTYLESEEEVQIWLEERLYY